MIRVKVSSKLIEDFFITGNIHRFKVSEGIPKDCKLGIVQFDGNTLSLFFSEPPEEVKEQVIACERIA